jgi:AcrR family transcriptional regulator
MERAGKTRVKKAPAVRRAELVDTAQGLFLARGYERTTINDVITATGLSKGAFYHHFRAKEDLLEAIAGRFARDCVDFIERLQADPAPDAIQRLNRFLSLGRTWKAEHMAELRTVFTTLMRPENALLHHRIVAATFAVLAPALARIIAEGQAEGAFAEGDPRVTAEAFLWLANGRRPIEVAALDLAERDLDAAMAMIATRMRAEGLLMCRVLGVAPGSVDLLGPEDQVSGMLTAWTEAGATAPRPAAASERAAAR